MDASKALQHGPRKTYGMGGFWALIATQFQGAFNDQMIQFLIQYTMLALLVKAGHGAITESQASSIPAIATVIFSIPFIVFVGVSGALSDRFSKQRVAVAVKYVEILIVCFGFYAFWSKNPILLWVLLFCMGTHSAFFGPAKYGILPETLPDSKLSWGNGILQMGTIIAIIAGTGAAGPIHKWLHASDRVYLAMAFLLVLTLLGLGTAQFMSRPPAANPTKRVPINPLAGMLKHFKVMYSDRLLLFTVIGYTYFWFAGALIRQNALIFGTVNLGLDESSVSYILASMAAGIGIGAVAAGYLSHNKIELGLVPIGTAGLALFSALLALPGWGFHGCLGLMFGLGFFGGFFDVPLAATLQQRSPDDMKGGIMATTNMLTFAGMLLAGASYMLLGRLGISTRMIFLLTSLFSIGVGVLMCVKLPMLILRSFIWVLTNTIYRVRVTGRENVPTFGGALLVANHTAFIDPGVVLASLDRPVRFLAFRVYYDKWWLRPFAKMFGAIPVSAKDGPKALIASLQAASEAIKAGELVCIFAEGEITRLGQLLAFRRGLEQVMKGVDAPIIPIYIDQLWGSVFSFSRGRFFWKTPKRVPYRISVKFGAPMPPDTRSAVLRRRIQEMGAEVFGQRRLAFTMLHRGFARVARRHPRLLCVADARTGPLSYIKAFAASIILARKLRALLSKEPMVGVLLPPTVGGAITNIALQFMGRVPVNLNYTASAQTIASNAEKCGITHCITAKAFLERLPVTVPGTAIYLEDVMKTVTTADRLMGFLLAACCPVRWLERSLGTPKGHSPDDLATVIFSSGSEGEPKGIMLTHRNAAYNICSIEQVIPYSRGDVLMGFLPFFHSFGFTGTLWAPITHGLGAVFHPSPLEAKAIGQLVKKYKAFFFIATPTFLQTFVRRCTAEDFQSVRLVFAGAEKLTPRVREAFKEKFNVEPLEAYGATECGPGISCDLPDVRDKRVFQRGNKPGTVGRPLPGVAVRVVDPDTGEVLGENQPGLLQVKSAGVMKGYLGMPEKTASVIQDGWYSTGDIASIDDEGFITLTDRLARFSKIAGEMISHTKVEETLHELLGLTEQALAVASVPDATRGERLVVLHTLSEEQLEQLLTKLDDCDLPNLWKPRASAFYRIDAIPVLGTGKMDIKAVRALALKLDLGDP